ncbi:hypothetical protein COT75_01710 [Candidatus Beckwithbacteria bacterium CG10_big_fil_rev_8_21_14_0_10_34_10]|uniref:Membrane protein 6-pyruvoyl-tetrahydropterin synthase-related domain-containing protein n=1 Tax=Candidatus Beckwithbacteria bacterium CG10_big_fil_rev_8_21_14_0_10_34_10 TaxID=1974495 RepID=A0A2H0W9M9_9BACT|nr:MAG: hypothetical protein COT75_01710 [Candidatus Beckwithbacteria bacterium CG10_big_fil_rev_8_21_14_0_10_34_10]
MKKLLTNLNLSKINFKFKIKHLFIVLILVICFFNLRAFFKPGIFRGHDLENHLARIANYYLSIKDSHIPPRWAKNLNHKFGYPVFNYLYPLPNILAYPLIVVGFGVENSLKIIIFSSYLFSGLFFYLWLKRHFSSLAAFLGSIFYLSAPYQFLDIYVRGIVGENLTFALFPGVLYFLDLLFEKKSRLRFLGLVVVTALFSLSHNIMVMLFTPLIFLYYFYVYKKEGQKEKLKFVNLGLIGLILGFLLTSFFWIPAYFEQNSIKLEAFDQQSFFPDHFVYLKQLIYSKWQYGFSVLGDGDTMSFQIGPVHLVIFLLALLILIKWGLSRFFGKKKKDKKLNLAFLLGGLAVFLSGVFLMLPFSLFIWRLIPLLGYLQFPWRFLGVVMLGVAVLAVVVSEKYKGIGIILAFVSLVYCQPFTKPFLWEKKQDMYYYDFLFTTSTQHEHTPRWFSEHNISEFKSRLTSDSGLVVFKELLWKTNSHIYEVDVPKATNIWEHTAYFPGWQVFIDGKRAEIKYDRPDNQGLIGVRVPAGKHKIVVKFTERTPARIIGNLITVMSLVLVLGIIKLFSKIPVKGWSISRKKK